MPQLLSSTQVIMPKKHARGPWVETEHIGDDSEADEDKRSWDVLVGEDGEDEPLDDYFGDDDKDVYVAAI
ncbi:hypothetical protein H0H92_010775 [Tricholoma furcatifolium]|nr:hypothetical protein H0H92_010775 [Tricholoma furcatifolium]